MPRPLIVIGEGDDAEAALFVIETEQRTSAPTPKPVSL